MWSPLCAPRCNAKNWEGPVWHNRPTVLCSSQLCALPKCRTFSQFVFTYIFTHVCGLFVVETLSLRFLRPLLVSLRNVNTLYLHYPLPPQNALNVFSFFSVAPEPYSGLCRLIVPFSRSRTVRNTHARAVGSYERVTSSSLRPLHTQGTINARDEHPCRQRVSNPLSKCLKLRQ
jgi:hypothetical protein